MVKYRLRLAVNLGAISKLKFLLRLHSSDDSQRDSDKRSKAVFPRRERHVPGFLRRVWAVDVVSRCRGVAGRAAMKR